MTTTQNGLERFVAKTRALFARENDPEIRWTHIRPIFAELLADPEIVAASKTWPGCLFRENRIDNWLFYEDPDYKFALNGLVMSGNIARPTNRVHDHAHIYTLYGILDGQQDVERYERIDDRSRKDYAELRPATVSACGPGEIDLVRPYEIHRETTIGQRSVALIARSERSGDFNQGRYLLDEKRYFESPGPRQTPMDIYNRQLS